MDDGILKNMMCTHYGILFNHKKEWSWDTCDKIDEPWKHAKWNKPETKRQMLYDFIYIKYLELANS